MKTKRKTFQELYTYCLTSPDDATVQITNYCFGTHPRAQQLYNFCYEEFHGYGYGEIFSHADDLRIALGRKPYE